MLVINRAVGERVKIGEDVWVQVTSIERGKVRLGIEAPRHVSIMREELLADLGPPPSYHPGRREAVRPDSDLARREGLYPESPGEQESNE